jgi:hypothetical protein
LLVDSGNNPLVSKPSDLEELQKRSHTLYRYKLADVANQWVDELPNVPLKDRWDFLSALYKLQEIAENSSKLFCDTDDFEDN